MNKIISTLVVLAINIGFGYVSAAAADALFSSKEEKEEKEDKE